MRILRIYVPTLRNSILALFVLSVGVIVSGAVGSILPVVTYLLISGGNSTPPTAVVVFCVIGCFAGSVGYGYLHQRFLHYRLYRSTALRTDRLRALFDDNRLLHRLPHRWLEHQLPQPFHSPRKLRKAVKKLNLRTTIVVSERRGDGVPPFFRSIPFEPVSVDSEDERVLLLRWQHWSKEGSPCACDGHRCKKKQKLFVRTKHLNINLSELLTGIPGLVVAIYGLFANRVWLMLVGVICSQGSVRLLRLFNDNQWWIVPRGLVNRRDRIWPQGVHLLRVTSADSPLILDARDRTALVKVDQKINLVYCSDSAFSLLLAAWISEARPPTNEELESLLGGTFSSQKNTDVQRSAV